jgi:hypothetical protein
MAINSFFKGFAITKTETVDRFEKGIRNIKTLNINPKDVITDMRKREEKYHMRSVSKFYEGSSLSSYIERGEPH